MKRRNFLGTLVGAGFALVVKPSAPFRPGDASDQSIGDTSDHPVEESSQVEVRYLDCEVFKGSGPCAGEACKFCANVACKRMREYLGMQEVSDD